MKHRRWLHESLWLYYSRFSERPQIETRVHLIWTKWESDSSCLRSSIWSPIPGLPNLVCNGLAWMVVFIPTKQEQRIITDWRQGSSSQKEAFPVWHKTLYTQSWLSSLRLPLLELLPSLHLHILLFSNLERSHSSLPTRSVVFFHFPSYPVNLTESGSSIMTHISWIHTGGLFWSSVCGEKCLHIMGCKVAQ